MRYTGVCPHCGAELALTSAPPAIHTCPTCHGRATLVVPEMTEDALAVAVIAHALPAAEDPVAAAVRRWRRPAALAAMALGAWLALALSMTVLAMSGSDSGPVGALRFLVSTVFGATIVLLVETLIAIPVVLVLFRRSRAPGATARRSVVAVIGGLAAVLLVAGLLYVWPLVLGRWPVRWPLQVGVDAVACVAGAWATIRLAPSAPYRHALAVGIVLLANAVLVEAPLELAQHRWEPLELLATSVYVPLLLAGAWLVLRLDRRRLA